MCTYFFLGVEGEQGDAMSKSATIDDGNVRSENVVYDGSEREIVDQV